MITKENISEGLKYIGMNLDDLPSFLRTPQSLNFNLSSVSNEKNLRVFRYVKIKDIDIFLTMAYRDDPIKEKIAKASHISNFLNPDDPKNIDKFTSMLNILEKINIDGINKIDELQTKMNVKSPFLVSFDKDQLWQIYYQEITNKYFMLVSVNDSTFDELFYIIKKKIEKSNENIYVPIMGMDYSEQILTKREISDIENYLWVFTKNWPLTFESYNKTGKPSINIVGETEIFDRIKSLYKITLKNSDDAKEFYKLTKALFIMKTQLGNTYDFRPQIENNHSLSFYYEDKKMQFSDLPEFIKEKYNETELKIKEINSKTRELEEKLKSLKEEVKQKDAEYFMKQKEISTYLEYKKTFFGKVKYFFKGKSKKKKTNIQEVKQEKEETKRTTSKPMQVYVDDKKFHTIDDLTTIYGIYEKGKRYVSDLNQDVKALELRKINVSKKIENATLYIEEIDKHKKNIFEFWKFANKDEIATLEVGDESGYESQNNFVKMFDYETDFEELGKEADKIQRTKFSKDETDSIYLTTTEVLPIINMLKLGNMDKDAIENILRLIKEEGFENESEDTSFDIFGGSDDSTKIKYIGSLSHRENEKSKTNILNITKNTDVFDFTEKIQIVLNYLKESSAKITSMYNMSIYKIVPISAKLHEKDYEIYNIDVNDEMKKYGYNQENAIKLLKLNIKEEFPIIYLSNIIFYDNKNLTLPVGMNLATSVLIDSDKFDFEPKEPQKFKINVLENRNDSEPNIVYVYVDEYNVEIKR